MHKLSVLLLTNKVTLVYRSGKFTVQYFLFGQMRDIKNTESDDPVKSLTNAVALAEQYPAIEILKPYYSPIVYDLKKVKK